MMSKYKTYMRNRSVVFGWVVGLAGCLAAPDRPTGRSDVAAALAARPEVEVLAAAQRRRVFVREVPTEMEGVIR